MIFWVLSIYFISIMLCQILGEKLLQKIIHNIPRYPNILQAIKVLNKVAYIPLLNTVYFVVYYICVVKNKIFKNWN